MTNNLFRFENNKWQKIETNDISMVSCFAPVKADKRNYCWLADYGGYSPVLRVYNGKSWLSSPEGILPDDYITTIETDSDNNIWVGTYQNGVFIINQ
jgi:ligand-binding sensor domain-containing protein